MRELKFRAYDTENNRMFEVYGLGRDFVIENTFDGVDPGTNAFCGYDMNFIKIMQFTGLTDKNGVDVFEDDIVKDILVYKIVWGEFSINEWTFTGWCMYINENLGLCQLDANFLEVIGNIHQNPELLK